MFFKKQTFIVVDTFVLHVLGAWIVIFWFIFGEVQCKWRVDVLDRFGAKGEEYNFTGDL